MIRTLGFDRDLGRPDAPGPKRGDPSVGALPHAACAWVVGAVVTVGCYPVRDLAKVFTPQYGVPPAEFFTSRWAGMASAPTQPALLAVPTGALFGAFYGTFDATSSVLAGAAAGGVAFGATKRAVAVYARRADATDHRGRTSFGAGLECVKTATARYGAFGWLQGCSVACPAAVVWQGAALASTHRRRRHHHASFGSDFVTAALSHSFYAFVGAPLRNAFRSALAVTDSAAMPGPAAWAQHEAGIWREGMAVSGRMFREMGPLFFFQGTLRAVGKSTLPFALTYALARQATTQ